MSGWRFAPDFLLRATGFPIERLSALGDDALAATRDLPDAARWEARVAHERRALFLALADDAAREAILTSAPLVDSNFDGWRAHAEAGRRNSQDKKRERVLWRFLQRLTAKNDSTSFFGAIAAGSFEVTANADEVLPIEASRRAYITQWVVERLLQHARAELAAAGMLHPEPRRAAGVDGEGRLWQPGARGFSHDEAGATRVDFDALPSGLVDPVAEAIARLARQPASAPRDGWLARFAEVEELRAAFAASAGDLAARRATLSAIDARIGSLMGEAARRGDGEFYASRSAVHEQADRTDTTVGLPAGWHAALTAASTPFLELALLIQAPERVVLRRWFQRTFEASREAPVLWREVLDAIAESPLQLELAAPASVRRAREALKRIRATLRAQIDAALANDPASEEVRLDPAAVMPEIEAALAALGPIGSAYANPDFMIALDTHAGARPTFILAEAHHLPCLTPCLLPSLAQEAPLVARTRALLSTLCSPDNPSFPVSYDHSFISVGPDLGAIGLELSGLAKEPPERRATFAELAVYPDADGQLRFVVPSHAGATLGVVPLTRTARIHQAAPVFPLSCPDLGRFLAGPDWRALESLPRLAFGELLVHRRRFQLTPSDLPALSKDAVRPHLAARAGIATAPRFMFARMGSEPKPILIDWGSALATELAMWSLARGETLELSEMSPAPEQCWLRSGDGHHTAELRTVLVRG